MTGNRAILTDARLVPQSIVTTANGNSLPIVAHGIVAVENKLKDEPSYVCTWSTKELAICWKATILSSALDAAGSFLA